MRSPAEVASRARLRYFSKTCRALPRTRPSGPLLSKVWVRGCPPPPPPPCCLRLVPPQRWQAVALSEGHDPSVAKKLKIEAGRQMLEKIVHQWQESSKAHRSE